VFGRPNASFLLVDVLLLVLGLLGFLDYEHEDDDEDEPSAAFSKDALKQERISRGHGVSAPLRAGMDMRAHFQPVGLASVANGSAG